MKTVLLDINVLLDVFLERPAVYTASAEVLSLCDNAKTKGFVCANSYPVLHYFLRKHMPGKQAINVLSKLRGITHVAPVDQKVIDLALASDFTDFEDAVQYYSALRTKADALVTRNQKDFKRATLPVLSPEEYLASLD